MIDLYTLPTPNGQKASIALEELKLPYETHVINIMKGDQFTPDYIKINPNSKIPSIVDREGPGGQPLTIMESGAILIYLAEKTGQLMPSEPSKKSEFLQWMFFQVGHIGPMFGQFGHFFRYAGDACDHPYPVERYTKETKRLLKVLDDRLKQVDGQWVLGEDYSMVDIAICPWVNCLGEFYKADEQLQLAEYKHVNQWASAFNEREAVKIGRTVGNPD